MSLHVKDTELRLGLPGSEFPEKKNNNNNNKGFIISGTKRVFSDTINVSSEMWVFTGNDNVVKENVFSPKDMVEKKPLLSEVKAQVVGWPPIRSFRKNSIASNAPKNNNDTDNKTGTDCLYVKVSMDGAPYLRKVDLKIYKSYTDMSPGLKKMFSCFTIGQCGSDGAHSREGLSKSTLMDLLDGSEYVLTYEDKDGDWMLVGDIPWELFTGSCRRMRILKSSEEVGLAPTAI